MQLLMFTCGDTSHNVLGIVIYIKVTISAWTITRRHVVNFRHCRCNLQLSVPSGWMYRHNHQSCFSKRHGKIERISGRIWKSMATEIPSHLGVKFAAYLSLKMKLPCCQWMITLCYISSYSYRCLLLSTDKIAGVHQRFRWILKSFRAFL